MKKAKKIDYGEHLDLPEGDFPDISDVASVNECTGLMPRPPQNSLELESYEQLSSMQIPKGANGDIRQEK